MVANLLSLRTSLTALQTMKALWSGEYMKIAVDLVYIDIGLHNYNKTVKLVIISRKHPEVKLAAHPFE